MRNGHGKWSMTVRNPWAGIRGLGVFFIEGRVEGCVACSDGRGRP